MGDFRVEFEGTGGHGCQRNIKSGEKTQRYCGSPSCPDCVAREFVRAMKRIGVYIKSAVLRHWPGQESEVKDDLVTGERTGSF